MRSVAENFTSQFDYGLKDLTSLKEQLYDAAEYLEVSYQQAEHKKQVIESSKDYITNALVTTVDHLGFVADKLTVFLDQRAQHFSLTSIRFACIQQRLGVCQEFTRFSGTSQFKLIPETKSHHKEYITTPNSEDFSASTCTPLLTKEVQHFKIDEITCTNHTISLRQSASLSGDNSPFETFQLARIMPEKGLLGEENPRESSPIPPRFAFTASKSDKASGKRPISPFRFSLQRPGSGSNRSVSPSSTNQPQAKEVSSEGRRSISAPRRRESRKSDKDMETTYTKKTMHLFKTMLRVHNRTT